MAKKTADVVVTGTEDVPNEVLAASIVKLSEGFHRMLTSGLNHRALCVLLKDSTGVSMAEISKILLALPRLQEVYVVAKSQKRATR